MGINAIVGLILFVLLIYGLANGFDDGQER